ncbi:MAG: hypothetical protein WAZ27_00635 [Minisyncoccia bacterium]
MDTLKRSGVFGGLLVLLIVPVFLQAAEFRTGDQPSFRAEETVTDDLYLAGGNVTSAGNLTGDLSVAGGNVLVSGPVSADVFASGGTITMLGAIGGDVRALGGNVIIQSDISGDVILGGGQVSLTGPRIGGDVAIGAGSVRIEVPIAGDVRIAGGDVYINAPIAGNVLIKAEKVTFGSSALIAGALTYSATAKADIPTGAVAGVTTFEEQPDVRTAAKAGFAAFLSLWVVIRFFMLLTGALFFGLFFLSYSTTLAHDTIAAPLYNIGRGILFLIVTPVVSIILLTTVIGLPIGVLGFISFLGAMIFAWLFSPIVVGSFAYQRLMKTDKLEVSWKSILLGVCLISMVGLIPILGPIAKFIITLATLGAVLAFKWELAKGWR